MTLPNFLVIGTPKSGTTSLYHYLNRHPQIYMSPVKEPNFLAFVEKPPNFDGPKGPNEWINQQSIVDFQEYQALFDRVNGEKAIGEASIWYLYLPDAPKYIQHYLPDVKLIALLRHPVDRAFSHYLHLRRTGDEWLTEFTVALDAEEQRCQQNWAPAWRYQQAGLYSQQLERYLKIFPRDRLKVYLYDDWQNNPFDLMKDLFTFIEVDATFEPDMSTRHNQTSVVWKNNTIRNLLVDENLLRMAARKIVPDRVRKPVAEMLLRKNKEKPPTLAAETRQQLISHFRKDILKLQDLIDRDLSHWLV
ncbi:MAG: sulfotransferase [Cyanobacteria bacterium SBLK]|nr:sulfotransferase [Cyanobacteria bacterium SBLK]